MIRRHLGRFDQTEHNMAKKPCLHEQHSASHN